VESCRVLRVIVNIVNMTITGFSCVRESTRLPMSLPPLCRVVRSRLVGGEGERLGWLVAVRGIEPRFRG
jgi:hypothetical protein